MIGDIEVGSIKWRFGSRPLLQAVQGLSNNRRCYRAYETIDFATRFDLAWFHALSRMRIPQSSELTDRSLKLSRDYVNVHDHTDTQTVLSQLSAYFKVTTRVIRSKRCSASAFLIRTRTSAPWPTPTMIDIGMSTDTAASAIRRRSVALSVTACVDATAGKRPAAPASIGWVL